LESLHYTEADLLIAIKDGKFNNLFPPITAKFLWHNIPEVFAMDGILTNDYRFLRIVTQGFGKLQEVYTIMKTSDITEDFFALSNNVTVENLLTGERYLDNKNGLEDKLEFTDTSIVVDNDNNVSVVNTAIHVEYVPPVQDENGSVKFTKKVRALHNKASGEFGDLSIETEKPKPVKKDVQADGKRGRGRPKRT
jgi:hypothetical protein